VIGLNEPGVDVKIKMQKGGKILHEEKIDQPEGFRKNYVLKGVNPSEVMVELKDAEGRTRTLYF
jgi:hypothetical protein